MGIKKSRPVHLMEFRRDVDGDYHHEPNGSVDDSFWVVMKPAVAGQPDHLGRTVGKWEARNTIDGYPSRLFDTLESAALWVTLEVANG